MMKMRMSKMQRIIQVNKPYALLRGEFERLSRVENIPDSDKALIMGEADNWSIDYIYCIKGSTAIIKIEGPIFRYPCFEMWWSGGVCIEDLANALERSRNDISIKQVLFYVNSPGGEVDGTPEFADMINKFPKPTYAYVSSLGASAGYWLAAATNMIFAQEAASIGSVGVYGCMYDISKMLEMNGVQELVFRSSQSPKKNPDPKSEEGRNQIQEHLDQIAAIFIDKLAMYRKTSAEKVISDFGQGNTLIAADALNMRMIDAISDFDETIEFIEKGEAMRFFSPKAAEDNATPADATPGDEPPADATTEPDDTEAADTTDPEAGCDPDEMAEEKKDEEMTEKGETLKSISAKYPNLFAAAMRKGARAENFRCEEIDFIASKNPGYPQIAVAAKYKDKKSAGEFAKELLTAKQSKREATSSEFAADKSQVPALNSISQQTAATSAEKRWQELLKEEAKKTVAGKR
jgi:signal peptide peptidase SppA